MPSFNQTQSTGTCAVESVMPSALCLVQLLTRTSVFYPCAAFVTQTAEAMTGAASIIVNDAGSVKLLSAWRPVAPVASKITQSALLNEA